MDHEEKQLNAVHEMDLDSVLQKLGVLDRFLNQDIKCKFCSTIMTRENVYSFFRESGNVSFVCSKPDCVSDSLAYIEERKKTKLEV